MPEKDKSQSFSFSEEKILLGINTPQLFPHDREKKKIPICHGRNVYKIQASNHKSDL